MSDVEKAISGLIEDEELLQQQHQQQQHQHLQQQSTPLTKANSNSYNTKSESGNNLLQHQQQQLEQLQYHHHQQQQQQHYITDTKYLAGGSSHNGHHSNNSTSTNANNCLSRLLKLVFSTPGLVVMVIVYTIMGALIFPLLEAPQDISKSAIIAKSREECLKELWIITEKLNVLYERNWTMLVHEQLRRFEGTIVAATRNVAANAATASASAGIGGGGGGGNGAGSSGVGGLAADASATTALGRFGGNNFMESNDFAATRWSFSEALLYSVTVITTIGHGSLTPRTTGGKIATILYALIGVPLMLMCLSSLGAILAEALQCTYARLCCRWPQYVHDDGGGGGGGGGVTDVSDDILDDDDDEDVDGMVQKPHRKRQHRRLGRRAQKHSHQRQCEFQDHKHGINCKNCKYDAIIGDTNTNNVYDYKCSSSNDNSMSGVGATTATASATPAAKHGYKEAGKLNQQHQLNSCMQLKMSPTQATTTAAQQHHHQQQQQHQLQQHQSYYQQRPDVMLMTTGHKLSSPATSCRLVMSQSSATATAAASLPTPPRFYSPPMATYHIVSSASANSSPSHQQTIRHYIIPPPTVPSGSATQHFMAVPSNMLRFQTSAVHCGSATSNLSINPLASGSTTTVYFPIVTPAAPQNPLALSSGNTTTAGTAAATILGTTSSLATSTLQPLVKYHTIQMPHRRRQSLTTLTNCDATDGPGTQDDSGDALPPPPPAYQTATVHGIRRAKFLTKPLPQEINTLLHESDISCRHDLSQSSYTNGGEQQQQQYQQQQVVSATPSATTATTATSHSVMLSTDVAMAQQQHQYHHQQQQQIINNLYSNTSTICAAATSSSASSSTAPASVSALTTNNSSLCESRESTTSPLTHMSSHHSSQTTADMGGTQCSGTSTTVSAAAAAATTAAAAGAMAAAVVDIMEDEEELEQQRLGNCPHGTPSRVPLLTCSAATSTQEDKSATRSFLHATAASFQRHTNFHRSHNAAVGQRKSMIINRKGECNLHIPQKRRNSAICYRDHMDTSDDDEFAEGENMYKLKHLHHHPPQTDKLPLHAAHTHNDELDNNSLVSYGGSSSSYLPQVPMLVVLVILIFYVCMGTVIFALWENWSLIDGAYFCFVTLTTIGYGDFVPLRTFQGPEIQLFACCAYLLLGLVLVAMSFSILETQLIWKCKRLAVRLKLTKE